MSRLLFNRANQTITLESDSGTVVGTWGAANNVDSASTPWPDGSYDFAYPKTHPDDGPNSAYGSYGIVVFDVSGRTGLGAHSGRRDTPDGLGRKGFKHATNGCIRTTDEAMKVIVSTNEDDTLTGITVA